MGYPLECLCVYCGRTFPVDTWSNLRKCCSDGCRDSCYALQNKRLANLTQRQREGKECLTCGRGISQPPGGQRKMYCSDHCSDRFRCCTTAEQRSNIRQQQRETQYVLKHGQPQPRRVRRDDFRTYVCKCCGEEFVGEKSRRPVYCSRDCNNKSHSYAGSSKQIAIEEICLPPSSATRHAAKEMRAAGKSIKKIAAALDCNLGTAQGWLRNTGQKTASAHHRPFSEPFFRYIYARNAAEWRAVLQDEMQSSPVYAGLELPQGKTVILVCDTIHARTKLYALPAIAESLGFDPLDGKTYAFCGILRETLVFFRWDGGGFQLTKRQRNYGRYVWPSGKVGNSIAVTALEFEFILYGSQQKERFENR